MNGSNNGWERCPPTELLKAFADTDPDLLEMIMALAERLATERRAAETEWFREVLETRRAFRFAMGRWKEPA
jgi:TRAP-type mannitol/chloroaromatic compound transport system substrate-binding protein